MARLSMIEAINATFHEQMGKDDRIVVMGEDVGVDGGVFRATVGLIEKFGELDNGVSPRQSRLTHAQFVVSPQPGYGKSHLIGRLFKKLRRRATLVYIRPFENPHSCWRTILLKMIREMEYPDQRDHHPTRHTTISQLETFAHDICMFLFDRACQRLNCRLDAIGRLRRPTRGRCLGQRC